uniref:Intraflagellar transport 74 n=1 Tax=Acanthochromis polyacanthus TaxID=80966 RepID=A0A3Q1FJW7_9TELE
MASQRPPSSMGRPMSRSGSAVPGAGRPPTAVRPPPTAIRVATGMVPGTSGHPGMRGGISITTPGVLSAQIRVTDRPVTQQGLSGMKTGMKGPQRQILDKSYYLGLLRSKINELTTETSKLHKEIDNYHQENSVYLSYEKRAEGLAAEIKDLQGQLADYNMLVDKLNTNTEMEGMIDDYNFLKAQNDSEAESIDSIFTERREREEAIRAMEEEIRRERRVADEVVQAMPAAKHKKYVTMTTTNEELLQLLLFNLTFPCSQELSHSQVKQEVVRLHETLSALESKRDTMEAEQKSLGSPKEELEKLFKKVKEDNQEIASMDRQLTEIRDRTGQITEEIRHLEQDSEAAQGKQSAATTLCTNCVAFLHPESQRLQQDLEKVQQLEGKITGELNTLKDRVNTMESELLTYRDLDTLRQSAEEKKKRLQEDRVSLTQRRDSFDQLLEEMNQKYEALKTKLEENETHAQLANLERKWQHLEQNNFVMKEFIASKSQESDYASVAKNVFQQVAEYNRSLIESLQSNKS